MTTTHTTRPVVTYSYSYDAYVIRNADGRPVFRDGFPLVYESAPDAEAALALL